MSLRRKYHCSVRVRARARAWGWKLFQVQRGRVRLQRGERRPGSRRLVLWVASGGPWPFIPLQRVRRRRSSHWSVTAALPTQTHYPTLLLPYRTTATSTTIVIGMYIRKTISQCCEKWKCNIFLRSYDVMFSVRCTKLKRKIWKPDISYTYIISYQIHLRNINYF